MFGKSILAALAGMLTVAFVAVGVQAAPSPALADLGAAVESQVTKVAKEVCEVVSPTESLCTMVDEDDDEDDDDDDDTGILGLLGDDDE